MQVGLAQRLTIILIDRAGSTGVAIEVDASDWAEHMVNAARDRLGSRARRVYRCDAAAMATEVADASFDAVVSNFGIVLVPDMPGAMQEAARALRPGGVLALTSWADDDWSTSLMRALAALVPDPASAANVDRALEAVKSVFDPGRVPEAMVAAGLSNIVVRRVRTASVVADAREFVALFIKIPFLAPVFAAVAQPGPVRESFLDAAAKLLVDRCGHPEPCVANRESLLITARRPE